MRPAKSTPSTKFRLDEISPFSRAHPFREIGSVSKMLLIVYGLHRTPVADRGHPDVVGRGLAFPGGSISGAVVLAHPCTISPVVARGLRTPSKAISLALVVWRTFCRYLRSTTESSPRAKAKPWLPFKACWQHSRDGRKGNTLEGDGEPPHLPYWSRLFGVPHQPAVQPSDATRESDGTVGTCPGARRCHLKQFAGPWLLVDRALRSRPARVCGRANHASRKGQ
jgi:hypothetical protein